MTPTFHPYDQAGRPLRATSNNTTVSNGHQGRTATPPAFGGSQTQGSMNTNTQGSIEGWYERALPPVHASRVTSASRDNSAHRQRRANPGNPYPVVAPASTNADVALYPSQSQPQPGNASPGFSGTLGQEARPLPQQPQPQHSPYPQPLSQTQTQAQVSSGSAVAGDALARQQWLAFFNSSWQSQAPHGGGFSNPNFFPLQQAFPAPPNGGWYTQGAPFVENAPQIARGLQQAQATPHTRMAPSISAPSAGQHHNRDLANSSYFGGVYPPALAPGNNAPQAFFAQPQAPPQVFAGPPKSAASGGVFGAVSATSYNGQQKRAPYQSGKAKANKGQGAPKKTRSSLQDQNRNPVSGPLPAGCVVCPILGCGTVLKQGSLNRHLKTRQHGGVGKICPLCHRSLSRTDSVGRHIREHCPKAKAGDDVDYQDEDEDEDGDGDGEEEGLPMPSSSSSGTRVPLVATQERVPQGYAGATGVVPPAQNVCPPSNFGIVPPSRYPTPYAPSTYPHTYALPCSSSSVIQDARRTPNPYIAHAAGPNGASAFFNANQLPQTDVGGMRGLPAIQTAMAQHHVFSLQAASGLSSSAGSNFPSADTAPEGSLHTPQAAGVYAENTHPASPAAYNYLYPSPEDIRNNPTPPISAAPCDAYSDGTPEPELEYYDEHFELGCLEDTQPDGVLDGQAESTPAVHASNVPGDVGSALETAPPTPHELAPFVEGHGLVSVAEAVERNDEPHPPTALPRHDTPDLVTGNRTGGATNDVACPAPDDDDDDLEAFIRGQNDYICGGNELYGTFEGGHLEFEYKFL